jgi:hypothetical protein
MAFLDSDNKCILRLRSCYIYLIIFYNAIIRSFLMKNPIPNSFYCIIIPCVVAYNAKIEKEDHGEPSY